ncbi:MAG: tetratricopeptide repeat protein [candidate division WOR-3 bacterium]
MPRRHHLWPLILFFFACILFKPNYYKEGIRFYKNGEFERAAEYFQRFYNQSPAGDSTLYYLYSCYYHLGKFERCIKILNELASKDSPDENVYLNLFQYYRQSRKFSELYKMLLNLKSEILSRLDCHFPLTRTLLAEIITGATTLRSDLEPVSYTIAKGYLTCAPDQKFYGSDTITMANFITILDRLIPPVYPRKFFVIKSIPANSYLYLPYMRLIDQEILKPIPELNPEAPVSISSAVQAIDRMKNKRFLK